LMSGVGKSIQLKFGVLVSKLRDLKTFRRAFKLKIDRLLFASIYRDKNASGIFALMSVLGGVTTFKSNVRSTVLRKTHSTVTFQSLRIVYRTFPYILLAIRDWRKVIAAISVSGGLNKKSNYETEQRLDH
jgi:hypothetical protein